MARACISAQNKFIEGEEIVGVVPNVQALLGDYKSNPCKYNSTTIAV